MAVARNADGRLEVFAVGTDRALIHIWQERPGRPPWSGWESLGASIHKAPAVCRNADGRLEVFAKSFSVYPSPLVNISQTAAGRAPWSAWTSLDGRLVEDWPVVARNQQNRLEVFARTDDHALSRNWQLAPGGKAWSGWAKFPGLQYGHPLAIAGADGNLELFAMGAQADLVHMKETAQSGVWSDWRSLGGQIVGDPGVGRNADGRLEAFANPGTAMSLSNIYQTAPNGGWAGWNDLDESIGGATPVVARNADGRLEVFVRDDDEGKKGGGLLHIWQTAPNNGWSGWHSLGGKLGSDPAVALNADGRLEVFAVGRGHYLYHIWQTEAGGDWSDWHQLGDWVVKDFGRGCFDP